MTIFASDEYPGAGTIAPSVHKISTALLAIPSMAAGGRPNLSLRIDNLLDNNVAVIGWQRDGCTLSVNVESTVNGTLSDSASFVEDKVGHESKVELLSAFKDCLKSYRARRTNGHLACKFVVN